jgi:multiple sugar transport system substrate-binding protein
MKYSKNQKVAKDFVRWYMDRAQYDKYFEVMDTFGIPATKGYRDHAVWKRDPKTAVFPETLQYARPVGFAGPPGRKATEALSKYILVDMFAKSIQGMKPEDTVAWAAGEMKKIYAGLIRCQGCTFGVLAMGRVANHAATPEPATATPAAMNASR